MFLSLEVSENLKVGMEQGMSLHMDRGSGTAFLVEDMVSTPLIMVNCGRNQDVKLRALPEGGDTSVMDLDGCLLSLEEMMADEWVWPRKSRLEGS